MHQEFRRHWGRVKGQGNGIRRKLSIWTVTEGNKVMTEAWEP